MDDYFRVGSNTKTMTSTVIPRLAQEGKLGLDDPVSKYRAGVPNGDKITLAELAEMRTIQLTDPAHPGAAGYGLGIAQFGPLIGHDGQLPGFMTFMGYDPKTQLTLVVATNLSAVPSGEGAALTLVKAMLPVLYRSGAGSVSNPAAPPGATEPTR